jgi:hypothetical protein
MRDRLGSISASNNLIGQSGEQGSYFAPLDISTLPPLHHPLDFLPCHPPFAPAPRRRRYAVDDILATRLPRGTWDLVYDSGTLDR